MSKLFSRKLIASLCSLAIVATVGILATSHPVKTANGPALEMVSAEAWPGCGLTMTIAPGWFTTNLAIVTVSNSQHNVTYSYYNNNPGTNSITLAPDDTVYVFIGDGTWAPYGRVFGSTTWSHCGTTDAPIGVTFPACAKEEEYKAYENCICPAAGSGGLNDVGTLLSGCL